MPLFYNEFVSPVGKLKLVANSNALVAVLWEREHPKRVKFDTANVASAAADYTGDRAPASGIFLRRKSRVRSSASARRQRVSEESLAAS